MTAPIAYGSRLLRNVQEARRAAFFRRASRWTPYLAAQIGEEVFLVRTSNEGLERGIFVRHSRSDFGTLERAVTWLEDHGLERPLDSIFVEVGANIGTTTVAAIRRFGFASAIALEPSPENFHGLRLNLLANDVYDRVTTLQVAASSRTSLRVLDTDRRHGGGHRLARKGKARMMRRKPDRVDVQVVTIDSLVRDGVMDPTRVGLLWIDTAGDEAKVICGASTFLERGVPIVAALRPPRMKPTAGQTLIDILERHGYAHAVALRPAASTGEADPLEEILARRGRRTLDVLLVSRRDDGAPT